MADYTVTGILVALILVFSGTVTPDLKNLRETIVGPLHIGESIADVHSGIGETTGRDEQLGPDRRIEHVESYTDGRSTLEIRYLKDIVYKIAAIRIYAKASANTARLSARYRPLSSWKWSGASVFCIRKTVPHYSTIEYHSRHGTYDDGFVVVTIDKSRYAVYEASGEP